MWFLPYVEDDFHMVWTPTCEFKGQVGFEEFYRNLTGNLFDRKHEVHDIKIDVDGDTAKVNFVIHLTAHVWHPPLPQSIHAENEAGFAWDDAALGEHRQDGHHRLLPHVGQVPRGQHHRRRRPGLQVPELPVRPLGLSLKAAVMATTTEDNLAVVRPLGVAGQ